MAAIDTNYSNYMHTYEAFRIPKGHEALNAPNSDLVKDEDGSSILILTEKSSKQLIKDRFNYADMLMANAQEAAQKTQEEAAKQLAQEQAKVLAVFRSMSKGNEVPSMDEKRLMQFDPKLYQAAKIAQMMAQRADKEKEKSRWNEQEEEEKKARQEKLNEEATEIASSLGSESHKFALAQEDMVVEIDAGDINLGSIQGFYKFTTNIGGAFFDQSI